MNTARFLKNVWPFFNIMHERVKWNNYINWVNSFMTEVMQSNQWTGFYMIRASIIKELSDDMKLYI